jgi:hypothetical protein
MRRHAHDFSVTARTARLSFVEWTSAVNLVFLGYGALRLTSDFTDNPSRRKASEDSELGSANSLMA